MPPETTLSRKTAFTSFSSLRGNIREYLESQLQDWVRLSEQPIRILYMDMCAMVEEDLLYPFLITLVKQYQLQVHLTLVIDKSMIKAAEREEIDSDYLNDKEHFIDGFMRLLNGLTNAGSESWNKQQMTQAIRQSLDQQNPLEYPDAPSNFSFDLLYSDFDIPIIIPQHTEEDKRFDLIFIPFVLQRVLNWRESAYKLLSMLKNGEGSLLFTEVIGDKCSMIGGYTGRMQRSEYKDKKGLRDFFKQFRKIRDEYFYWHPEISTYDMQALKDFCLYFFDESNAEETGDNEFLSKHNPHFNQLRNIIDKYVRPQVISYFQLGLEQTMKDDGRLQALFDKPWNHRQTVSDGVRITLFKGFNADLFQKHSYRSWKPNQLITKIQQLPSNENTSGDIGRKILDLLLSHDIIIPDRTAYIGIMPWNIQQGEWGYPLQLALNLKGERDKYEEGRTAEELKHKYFKYLCFQRTINFSIHRFIFLEQEEKFMIRINFVDQNKIMDQNVRARMIQSNQEIKLPPLFEPKYNNQGAIEELEIRIPYWYKKEAPKYIQPNSDPAYPSEWNLLEEYEQQDQLFQKVWIKAGTLKRLSISRELINAFEKHYDYKSILNKVRLDDFNNNPKFSQTTAFKKSGGTNYITYVANTIFRVHKSQIKAETFYNNLVNALYGIASIFDTDEEIILYPSAIIQEESQTKGFGGIMMLERKVEEEDKTKNTLHFYNARNKLLKIMTNVIFSKLGIQDWVSKPYREHSLKAAIATVISRNGSHGLGSHVLSNVANGVDAVTNYNTLTQYMHQRLDFIAQVASEIPKWTIPVWFTGDLMMRFYSQKFILDTLLATEGVRAYSHLIEGGDIEELVLPEMTDEEQQSYHQKSVILYGKIISVSEEKIVLKQKGSNAVSHISCSFQYANPTNRSKLKQFAEWCQKVESPVQSLNREIKLRGILRIKREESNKNYLLDACQIIDAQFILKIRRRKFLRFERKSSQRYSNKHLEERTSSEYINHAHEAIRLSTDLQEAQSAQEGVINIYGIVGKNLEASEIDEIYLVAAGEVLKKNQKQPNALKCVLSKEQIRRQKNEAMLALAPEKNPDSMSKYAQLEMGDRVVVKGQLVFDEWGKVIRMEDCEIVERIITKYIVGSRIDLNTKDQLADDIQVAIPGGLAGYQAFYTLIENIVRNSAKHSWSKLKPYEKFGKNLELKVDLEEVKNTEHVICRIWNNMTTNLGVKPLRLEKLVDNWVDEEYEIYKAENPKQPHNDIPIHRKINYMLCRSLVDENGKLRKENLGMAEMKVSSGYLSNQDMNVIGNGTKDQILLRGISNDWQGFIRARLMWEVEADKLVPRLGYKIKLLRPREIGIISEDFDHWFLGTSPSATGKSRKRKFGKKAAAKRAREGVTSKLPDTDQVKTTDFNIKVIKHQSTEPLDFEFMIIADDTTKGQQRNKLIQLLYDLLNAEQEEKREEILKEAYKRIETYPYRLFIISDELSKRENRQRLRTLNYIEGQKFSFIEKRIVFKKFSDFGTDFNDLVKYPEKLVSHYEYFKLVLYIWWIDHLSGNYMTKENKARKKYGLRVNVGEGEEVAENITINFLKLLHRRHKKQLLEKIEEILKQQEQAVIEESQSTLTKAQYKKCSQLYLNALSNVRNEEILSIFDAEDMRNNELLRNWNNLAGINQDGFSELLDDENPQLFARWLRALNNQPWQDHFSKVLRQQSEAFRTLALHSTEEIETLPRVFSSQTKTDSKKDTGFHQNWEKSLIQYIRDYEYKGLKSDPDAPIKAHRYFGISGEAKDIKYLNNQSADPEHDRIISYNRHGELGYNRQWNGIPIIYEEALSGSQIFFSILKDPPNRTYLFNKLILQLIENAFPKFLIMDERVENYIKLHNQAHKRLNKTNIYIAHQLSENKKEAATTTNGLPLGQINIKGTLQDYIISYHKKNNQEEAIEFTTLVIHYGIVEKRFNKDKEKINEFFFHLKNYIPSVIVTSGRGKPGYISEYVKFLAYSNIENFILKPFPEKLLLNQILLKAINVQHGY
ncbi:MAG: hypothetical protein AAGG75_18925 [Bacteroidota bacterium]